MSAYSKFMKLAALAHLPRWLKDATGKVTSMIDPNGLDHFKVRRICAAIEAALRNNPYINAPLAPAPTWAALTVYYGGMIVRGAAAGSTNNLYLCCGSTSGQGYTSSGTSAATGGPSGTGSALITDATVVWQYIGRASSAGTYPTYSTVTPTTSTDVMNGYVAFASSDNVAAMGLTNTYNAQTSPAVTWTNGNVTSLGVYTPPNSGTVASPIRSTSTIYGSCKFITNAKKWIALGNTPIGGGYGVNVKGVKINGQWLSESPLGSNTLVNPCSIILDLTTFGPGFKVIEIFFYDTPTTFSGQIAVGADEYIAPFQLPNNFKIALEGDSLTNMTYLSSSYHYWRSEVAIGEMLGCGNVYNNSIGGTGFISNNNNTGTTYIQRLPDITAFGPDLLLIGGAHNDNQSSSAVRQAADLAYLQAARAVMPNVTIGLSGPLQLQGDDISSGASTSQLSVEQDLLAAFNTWGDKNSFFIPILTASPKAITSVANGYFFNAGGSAPYNNSHPTSWYYYYLMEYFVQVIKSYYWNK